MKPKAGNITRIISFKVAFSHAEIHNLMVSTGGGVTVYRILDRLTREGPVYKVIDIACAVKYTACHYFEEISSWPYLLQLRNRRKVICAENAVP